MSIVSIEFLTKLFPFLGFLFLMGCPGEVFTNTNSTNSTNSKEDIEEVTQDIQITEFDESKLAAKNYTNTRENRMNAILSRLDSINTSLEWKLIKNNLYKNNKGEIGFQINFATEVGSTKNYISTLCNTDSIKTLNDIIDIKSFTHLGSTFYKDKKHIYHYYDMAYGGKFYIYTGVDHSTFKIVGDHYAKDKNSIYGERAGILKNIDYKTFTSQKGVGPYAKDKHGYYFWDDLIMSHKEFKTKYKRASVPLKEFIKLIRA